MGMHVTGAALRRILVATAMSAMLIGVAAASVPAWAAASSFRPLTVTQDGTITGLMPGGAPQPIRYTINNPNVSERYATGVTVAMAGITYVRAAGSGAGSTWLDHPAGGAAPGCTPADFAIVAPDALHRNLAIGDTSQGSLTDRASGTIAMIETGRNQNDCQGVEVTLTLSVR